MKRLDWIGTATTIDSNKITEGWVDSGRPITIKEAIKELLE